MFKYDIGDVVVATDNSLDMRLNDPECSLYFEGYAYGSENDILSKQFKIVNRFEEFVEYDDTKGYMINYYVCKNTESKYKESYILNEDILRRTKE